MEIVYSPIIRPGNSHARVDSTFTWAVSKSSSFIVGMVLSAPTTVMVSLHLFNASPTQQEF